MPPALTSFLRYAAIAMALAFAFTWFGVYGSRPSFGMTFLMWTLTIGTGNIAAMFAVPFAFGARFEKFHVIISILSASMLIAFPVMAALLIFMVFSDATVPLAQYPLQYIAVLAVCILLVTIGYLFDRSSGTTLAPVRYIPGLPKTSTPSTDTFIERLPMKYRGATLYAISSEDHYLRVHTDRGEELILMRLADAIRELDGANGRQTHRSWWVAKDGVSDVRRAKGKLILHLKSGAEAPVSRTYQAAIKEMGLI